MARHPVAVFAVDERACQLVWRSLPAGRRRLTVGETEVGVMSDGGPGSVWVDGLPPGRRLPITLDGRPAGQVRTRPALTGPVLAKVATISDLHLGEHAVGRLPRLPDPPNLRCLEAALEEIVAWGADLLVVKGDLTCEGRAWEWSMAIERMAPVGLPIVITPGNHDSRSPERIDARGLIEDAGLVLTPAGGIEVIDLAGLRVIVGDTTTGGQNLGSLQHIEDDIAAAAEDARGAVLVALHHHLQPLPVAHHWPPGIPSGEGGRFARRLDRSGRPTIITSGHTHRHRARRYGRVWATEVGSVKDYPGVWAGYEAHAGGLRQTVHRVGAPDVLRWTDRTASIALGVWGRWSPGRLDHRCLEVTA